MSSAAFASVVGRGPRGTETPRSRSRARASRAAGSAPRSSKDGERPGHHRGVGALRERASRLVRTAALVPERRCRARLAGDLEPVRLSDPVGSFEPGARLPLPVRELAREPEVALLERKAVDGSPLVGASLERAAEPGRLGPGRATRPQTLEVATLLGQRERLVEGAPGRRDRRGAPSRDRARCRR